MVDVSLIGRLVLGVQRNVDISQNTLIVGSLKVGTSTPVELTKTIVTNLIALQNGSDFATGTNSHTHDGRYFTETELSSVTGVTGSDLIGDDNTYTNFTPTTTTIKGALAGIDSALSTGNGKVKVTAADTNADYLNNTITAGAGLSKSVTNPGGDETLDLAVNVDNSSIEINADTLRVKASGITSAMLAGSIDATKIADGSVTSTEFQFINSLTSNAQDQIDSKVAKAGDTMSGNLAMGGNKVTGLGAPSANGDALRFDQLGANNGIATLDGGGKIPVSQLPNSVMEYLGTWAASTNTPTLANGTGNAGDVYVASDAGTVNFGAGNITFAAGDWVVYSGSVWQKSVNSNAVASVNGQTGIVTVNAINQLTGDVTASAATQSESKATTVAAIQGTTVSGTTGTGNVVFSASPTITGTLSAATISASGTVTGSNLSGTNTGDQTITLTGNVTGSGTGSFATTIASGVVTNSMLANVATATFKGRATAGTGSPEDLTGTQATALLNQFTTSLKGLAPASGGGTTNFLRADGTWTNVSSYTTLQNAYDNDVNGGGATITTNATDGAVVIAGTEFLSVTAQKGLQVSPSANTGDAAIYVDNTRDSGIGLDIYGSSVSNSDIGLKVLLESTTASPLSVSNYISSFVVGSSISTLNGASATHGALLLYNSNSSGPALSLYESTFTFRVNLKVPSALAANYTLTLPLDDGNPGQTLTTDGSGVLSWASGSNVSQSTVAGEALAANTSFFVRYAISGETAGRAYKADQDTTSSDKFYAYGVTMNASAVSAAGAIQVLTTGTHTLGSSDTAFSAGDIGKPVYLTSAGAFSTTAPTAALAAVYRVGVVATTTTMWVGNMQINGVNA